jgi:hypothetical protein
MQRIVVATIMSLVLSSTLQAQSLAVRLEACNAIKNSKQRLDCLKAATSDAPTPVATEVKAPRPEPLTVGSAATICERLLPGLQSKHDLASEESARSTESELAVTWPPNEGKTPTVCVVSRSARTIVAIESNGKVLSGSQLAEIERDAGFREDIKAGKYEGFVSFTKEALIRSFKDPGAVQFRGVFISGKAMPVLCGEVNGKNSYGAYVGFRRFYSTGKAMLTEVEPARDAFVFERMWPTMCGEKVADITEQ